MFGGPPPPPPRTLCHRDILLLHYNMSFKTIADGFNGAFWWYGPFSEDQDIFLKQIYQNYLVALMYDIQIVIL